MTRADVRTALPALVAFDLDDTLAPSKSPLDPHMAALFERLLARTQVCVISGGRFEQFRDQLIARLPATARREALHLMPTCGTRYLRWIDGEWRLQYAEDLTATERSRALAAVEEEASRLGFWRTDTWGPPLEDRGSQITFSALGQDAPVDAKRAWDPDGSRRNSLRAAVQERLPELEVRSGGSTSIDITRHGVDKAYGMSRLAAVTGIPYADMLFVGDRLDPDGNDFPVVRLGIPTRAVTGWEDTARVVEGLLAAS
ncbi:HAD-IIB family hydrolase [Leifsonia sp. F6_8S_P_1B]|uniref:phosphomannomutase n=1 Tax=Leifsonia williamsii TaxID=3035919 RepID=A0ABT8K851_9MICO|nr:HAD-IIB family hydrolase [Leifsonia williamsii]MDN4613347.1 HAD-IIB family hydrolase [Leifsonia williamsii]